MNPDFRRGEGKFPVDGTGIQNYQRAIQRTPSTDKLSEHSLRVKKIPREQGVWVRGFVPGGPQNCHKMTIKFLRRWTDLVST